MALWQNIPGKTTKIDKENLSRMEKYNTALCVANSDYKVDFKGANGLENHDTFKFTFNTSLDNTKQARLSIDNGTTYYDIDGFIGEKIENQDGELTFKVDKWVVKSNFGLSVGAEYDTNLGGAMQITGDGIYYNGLLLFGWSGALPISAKEENLETEELKELETTEVVEIEELEEEEDEKTIDSNVKNI